MQVHLVDGTYELFRFFFALPSRQSTGVGGGASQEIAATRGALGALLALVARGATHVGIATDKVITSFRNDLYAGYKTGEGIQPELLSQFPLFQEAAVSAGFCVWPMEDFEADDALATAAYIAAADKDVERVVICSPDKDMTQCLTANKRIVMYDSRKKQFITYQDAKEKFAVPPEAMPDYLALVGDSADGIEGVEHWGAKSTASALSRYGQLENIPDDPGKWDIPLRGIPKLAASLKQNRSKAELFKQLTTLRLDVPGIGQANDWRWVGPKSDFASVCEFLHAPRLLQQAEELATSINTSVK